MDTLQSCYIMWLPYINSVILAAGRNALVQTGVLQYTTQYIKYNYLFIFSSQDTHKCFIIFINRYLLDCPPVCSFLFDFTHLTRSWHTFHVCEGKRKRRHSHLCNRLYGRSLVKHAFDWNQTSFIAQARDWSIHNKRLRPLWRLTRSHFNTQNQARLAVKQVPDEFRRCTGRHGV